MSTSEDLAQNPTETDKVSVGFLLSGGGRTLENLLSSIEEQQIPARIDLVIASKDRIGGINKAKSAGILTQVHPCRDPQDSEAIFKSLETAGCELAILGGWLRKLAIPAAWENRVINIHPSLLPRHGGKGCYGEKVHRKVLESGDERSGCTVHFVDNHYDRGPIILQEEVPVLPGDDADTLAARVFEAEKVALPKAVAELVRGDL